MVVLSSSLELTATTVVELSRIERESTQRPIGLAVQAAVTGCLGPIPGWEQGASRLLVLIWLWLAQPSYCINPCSYLASCISLFLPEPINSLHLSFISWFHSTCTAHCIAHRTMRNCFALFARVPFCHLSQILLLLISSFLFARQAGSKIISLFAFLSLSSLGWSYARLI